MLVGLSVLTGCVDKDMVKYAATYKLKNDLFRETIDTLLVLDDKTILETDTFRNMLSSAYYALNLKGELVAEDCTDMDVTPDGKTVVFSDYYNGKVTFYSYPDMKLKTPSRPVSSFRASTSARTARQWPWPPRPVAYCSAT